MASKTDRGSSPRLSEYPKSSLGSLARIPLDVRAIELKRQCHKASVKHQLLTCLLSDVDERCRGRHFASDVKKPLPSSAAGDTSRSILREKFMTIKVRSTGLYATTHVSIRTEGGDGM